jgi:tryptophanyl-tRNA synthetase
MVSSPSLRAIFASKVVRPFNILTEFMNKHLPAKKPQAKIQTVKKQIPVKKIAPDKIEELVKKHLANISAAENTLKSALALLEKHKTKYPELEQYVENVSSSDRSIQMLDDVKDPRRAHYIFKIAVTGVVAAYQVTHPGEKDHSNVEQAAWISDFEEALAKAIAQIILARQSEPASK